MKATGTLGVDLLGVVAAVAAAGASWLAVKQYSTLAEAYTVAAHELALTKERVNEPTGGEMVEIRQRSGRGDLSGARPLAGLADSLVAPPCMVQCRGIEKVGVVERCWGKA